MYIETNLPLIVTHCRIIPSLMLQRFFQSYQKDDRPFWVKLMFEQLAVIMRNQGTIMLNLTQLKAVTDRLQASSTSELALLQSIKDQNTALAAQLAALSTSDPTTQAAIDAVVAELTGTADAIDAAVAANPATPNLTPSPAPAADAPSA